MLKHGAGPLPHGSGLVPYPACRGNVRFGSRFAMLHSILLIAVSSRKYEERRERVGRAVRFVAGSRPPSLGKITLLL